MQINFMDNSKYHDQEYFEGLLEDLENIVNTIVERFPEATFYSNTPQWKEFPLKRFSEEIKIQSNID